jgi:hypothetical protein
MRRLIVGFGVLGFLSLVPLPTAALPATAAPPEAIALPDGFRPEGIVFGEGPTFYVGSLATGGIYRADARTGEGELAVPSGPAPALGLAFDRRTKRLFVASGPAGGAVVYDTRSGEQLAAITFTTESSLVNDVVLTRDAAWFTDSVRPVLYRMSLDDPSDVSELTLGGDFTLEPGEFGANGIVAMNRGDVLVIVRSDTGQLFSVDPESGDATLIDLGDETVVMGDGLVARGRDIYVIQNDNQVSVARLDRALDQGEVRDVITSPGFRSPSTADRYRRNLYVVNARFDTPAGPDVDYDVVRVRA